MGAFIRVWIPDHMAEAVSAAIERGAYADREEVVNWALADLLDLPVPPPRRTPDGET